MAQGYLSKGATNTDGMSYDALLYCKTNIGGYFFDGFITVDIKSELNITSNPVETGSSVVDHAYMQPKEIEMQIKMSDVLQSLVAGQFTGGWSRSANAYNVLIKIQQDRIPVAVLCRLGLFNNMLIKSITANDDSDTYQALDCKVVLAEIPIARVKTVEISSESQTTINTEMGKINALTTNDIQDQSILYTIVNGVGG
jgi:hypothetical protein